jgi:hypothetical protein
VRFVPGDVAAAGVKRAGIGRLLGDRLLASGTGSVGVGSLVAGGGLPLETLGQQLFGQGFADGEGDILQLGESGSPRGTVGSVEAIDQVFGDAGDEGPNLLDFRPYGLSTGHPCLLARLMTNPKLKISPGV